MDTLFTKSPIKARVMKAITERIQKAEVQYVEKCVEIDQEAEQKKSDMADALVTGIIGKIL